MNDQITITHPSGASATIHPFGATITSFKTAAGREKLFVSRCAKLDGTKAIRGGIPICFPQFGQPDTSMPQHGFARCNYWIPGKAFEEGSAVCQEFQLSLVCVEKARGGKWEMGSDIDCEVYLTVKVTPFQLITVLRVVNEGEVSFPCQGLFHTYYHVDGHKGLDASTTNVVGLANYKVEDKVTKRNSVAGNSPISIDGSVDRIYRDASKMKLDVSVNTGGSSSHIQAWATAGGKPTPVSAVVWNPFRENAAKMGDFGDDQYVDMICVEPGVLDAHLEPDKELIFEQTITCTSDK